MKDRRAAARYAEALLRVAGENHAVEAIRRDLADLVALVQATPALGNLLQRPDMPAAQKSRALSAALGEEFSAPVIAMVGVLLRHGRGGELAEVADVYHQLADEAEGLVRAEARSVVPLTREQRSRLLAMLTRITGKQVALEERLDPAVLAGVRVQVGDRLIDGSAAGRLAQMRKELVGGRG